MNFIFFMLATLSYAVEHTPDCPRGGRPQLNFHNQHVQSKFNLLTILHVIDDHELLSSANAIEFHLFKFPWLISLKLDLQGRNFIAGVNF